MKRDEKENASRETFVNYLSMLTDMRFFGRLTIVMQEGRNERIFTEQSLKPSDLPQELERYGDRCRRGRI